MKLRLRRPRPARLAYDPPPARLTGGQLAALVVGLVAALLLAPVGAQAATSLLKVAITDPADATRQAHVDAAGNLQVAGSVNVANTPLAVTSADDPGRLTFQTAVFVYIPVDFFGSNSPFTVPAGKRLVIRYVSAYAELPIGQRLISVALRTSSGGNEVVHQVVPVFTGSSTTQSFEAVGQDTQLYADPGSTVLVAAVRTASTGHADVEVKVSGYLIDCAAAPCG